MLNAFPPGGAPPAINRQLPQGLSVPGLQQQAAGVANPYANPMQLAGQGMPAQQSGINLPMAGAGMPGAGMPGTGMQMGMPQTTGMGTPPQAPTMLGQQPPGATGATPSGSQIPGLQGTPEGQMQSFAQALNPGGGY